MKKKFDAPEAAVWVAALLPFALTAAVYAHLPPQIPVHWGISGAIDAYGPKAAAWLFPVLAFLVAALLKWMPRLDPKRESYAKFKTGYRAFRLVFALFFLVMTATTLYAAFAPAALPVGRIITLCLGAVFCVLGNYMPKFRHNYFCGMRTPWTLASEEVWVATHRMAGPLWFAGGLALMAAALLPLSQSVLFVIVMALVFLFTLVPCVYSYFLYQKTQKPSK
ncbi:MAG: SdpI family protein [Ruthenibacterium sp.]